MRVTRTQRRLALAISLVPVAALTIGSALSSAAQQQAAINPAKKTVRFGDRVVLRGKFPGSPNAPVSVQYRRAGSEKFREVAATRTGEDARWKRRVKPRGTGKWRARLAPVTEEPGTEARLLEPVTDSTADRESNSRRVRVRSITRVRTTKRHAVSGDRVRIRGRVAPRGKRRVTVRVGGQRLRTRTNSRGRFGVRWRAGSTGTRRVVAKAHHNRKAMSSRDRGGRVAVYRRAMASWYGPGFFGNRTACGQTLTTSTLGVAHKTMPCGTKLKLRNSGKTVTVRVIDRGPYVHGREFDLTQATKNRLGFGSTGTILTSK
jgi:rare lipoprotein A (peptidoglycan hydrolase)